MSYCEEFQDWFYENSRLIFKQCTYIKNYSMCCARTRTQQHSYWFISITRLESRCFRTRFKSFFRIDPSHFSDFHHLFITWIKSFFDLIQVDLRLESGRKTTCINLSSDGLDLIQAFFQFGSSCSSNLIQVALLTSTKWIFLAALLKIFQLTNSKMRSFSSNCRSSCLDLLCGLLDPPAPTCCPLPVWPESSGEMLKNVGVPSIVLTIGLSNPPRSNSWAEIFLTGVVAPDPPPLPLPLLPLPPLPLPPGEFMDPLLHPELLWFMSSMELADEEVGVACVTSHASTVCLVTFLQKCKLLNVRVGGGDKEHSFLRFLHEQLPIGKNEAMPASETDDRAESGSRYQANIDRLRHR